MNFNEKKYILFLVLCGFFITNAIVAELIGGKLIQLGPFVMSIGIIPWPVVFITTDLINEYFGKPAVKRLTILTSLLISYSFVLLYFAMKTESAIFSPVKTEEFRTVFGQSNLIIIGSIIAFLVSQFLDSFIFWFFRSKTGNKHLWLRATGSTTISQLVDTFIVGGIAFWLPGKLGFKEYINMSSTGYLAKLLIAVILTPVIYMIHQLIDQYLGEKNAETLTEQIAEKNIPQQ